MRHAGCFFISFPFHYEIQQNEALSTRSVRFSRRITTLCHHVPGVPRRRPQLRALHDPPPQDDGAVLRRMLRTRRGGRLGHRRSWRTVPVQRLVLRWGDWRGLPLHICGEIGTVNRFLSGFWEVCFIPSGWRSSQDMWNRYWWNLR